MSPDKEREAFEAWWYDTYHAGHIHADSHGVYHAIEVQAAWEAWRDRAALASQQAVKGEPVAWFRYENGMRIYYETKAWDDLQPLFASPPSREPLTDEQIDACWDGLTPSGYGKSRYDIARAIERAHGIHSRGEGES